MSKGRLHVYTGDGKGKTTASLGLLIRFLGRGGRARMIQFDKTASDKGELHGERRILMDLKNLDFSATGMGRFDAVKKEFRFENTEEDRREAARGLALAKEAVAGDYGLVVLDEVLSLALTKLASQDEILSVVTHWQEKGRRCELVVTGHVTWPALTEKADLITQMRKVKHYFDQGHEARESIDY